MRARAQASLASGCVDVCLIPEVSFDLYGEQGMLAYVKQVLQRKGHAVVCVAEGAGQARPLLYLGHLSLLAVCPASWPRPSAPISWAHSSLALNSPYILLTDSEICAPR